MKLLDASEIIESPRVRTSTRVVPVYKVPRKVPEVYTSENLTDSDYEDDVAKKNEEELLDFGFIGAVGKGFEIAKEIILSKTAGSYYVWNGTTEKRSELEDLGVIFAINPKIVFDNVDVIFYFIPGDEEAERIFFKLDVIRSFRNGKGVVIMSTISTHMARAIEASVTDRAGRYLELQASRSDSHDRFVMVCSGDYTLSDIIKPTLDEIAETVLRLGDRAGTAITHQMALEVLQTQEMMVLAECFAGAEKCNLNVNKERELIKREGTTIMKQAAACIANDEDVQEFPVRERLNEIKASRNILPQSLFWWTRYLGEFLGKVIIERRYMSYLPNAVYRIFRRS